MRILIIILGVVIFSSCSTLSELMPQGYTPSESKGPMTEKDLAEFNRSIKKNNISKSVQSWALQKLLIRAIKEKNILDIRKYLNEGANPNRGEDEYDYISAICRAIKAGCYDCINEMASKTDFDYTLQRVAYLPLTAAGSHSLEMTRFIMENYSPDPNAEGYGFCTEKAPILVALIEYAKAGVIEYLLANGANPNGGDEYCVSWKRYLSSQSRYMSVSKTKAFVNAGATLNYLTSSGNAIANLISHEKFDHAKILLENGADPNYCESIDDSYYTPLYYAVEENNLELVKLLIQKGADINAGFIDTYCRKDKTSTPLDHALSYKRIDRSISDYLVSKGAR